MKNLTFVSLAIFLSGCASTELTGFTDPGYDNKLYTRFVIVTPNLDLSSSSMLQTEMCAQISKSGASCYRGVDIFPPTRDYGKKERAEILRKNLIDGFLVTSLRGSGSSKSHFMTGSFGTATVYNNLAQSQSTSVPMYSFSRRDSYDLILVDTGSHQKAWVGSAIISASGLANITDRVFAYSLAEKVSTQLKDAGHL